MPTEGQGEAIPSYTSIEARRCDLVTIAHAPELARGGTPELPEDERLRVLMANERKHRLALAARIVVALGHEVIAREIHVDDAVPTYRCRKQRPTWSR
jgi:hypothetical protein